MNTVHTLLITIQAMGVIVLLNRYMALYVNRNRKTKYFGDEIIRHIRAKLVYHNSVMLNKNSQPLDRVTCAASDGLESMNYVLMDEQAEVEKYTSLLSIFGNVATLIGLIGTIAGMLKAFGNAGLATDLATKKTLLVNGILEAMLMTAHGLFVAIPFLIAYAVFTNRANILSDELNKAAAKIYVAWKETYETDDQSRNV